MLYIWIICSILLIIGEILTFQLWMLCMAVGCIAALITWISGANLAVQIIIMAIATLIAYIAGIPLYKRIHKNTTCRIGHRARTGMEALLGRKAEVVHDIRPGQIGRVRIDGDFWQARSPHTSEIIRRGDTVVVEAYDSIILTVQPSES